MAALPNTDLTFSLIREALGTNTNKFSEFFTYSGRNRWGFNSPVGGQQTKCWGKDPITPASDYQMGCFRRYDHLWRCYSYGEFNGGNPLTVNEDTIGVITIPIRFFPAWSEAPASPVTHHFKIEWNSTSDFDHETQTLINADYTITDNNSIALPNLYTGKRGFAPDGSTVLNQGDGCYYKITYLSSDARRWDSNQSLILPAADSIVIPITIGASPWTWAASLTGLGSITVDGYIVAVPASEGLIAGNVTVQYSGYSSCSGTVNADFCKLNSFDTELAVSASASFSFGASETPGTRTVTVSIETYSGVDHSFDVGDPIYVRIKLTGVTAGITNNSSAFSTSAVVGEVVNTLPS